MKHNRKVSELNEYETLFNRVVEVVSPFAKRLGSKAVTDAVLYGVAKNIDQLEKRKKEVISGYFEELLDSEEFSELKIREGVAQKNKVLSRLDKAKSVFSGK